VDEPAQDEPGSTLPTEPEPIPYPPAARQVARDQLTPAGPSPPWCPSPCSHHGYGGVVVTWTKLPSPRRESTRGRRRPQVPLDGAVDILLVGMDSRTDAYGNPLPKSIMDLLHAGINDGERNTDTMILVHIPVDAPARGHLLPARLLGGLGAASQAQAQLRVAYAYNDARAPWPGRQGRQGVGAQRRPSAGRT